VVEQGGVSVAAPRTVLVVGWGHNALERLWLRVAEKSGLKFVFVMHPKYTRATWTEAFGSSDYHFFFDVETEVLPAADSELLAALESDRVPTVHNMIKGDRVVSKLDYADALAYATYLAQRLENIYNDVAPMAVIGGFDAVHSGMALAVARPMGIPWYTMNFSVIPSGLVCLCDEMHPGARVQLEQPDKATLMKRAEEALSGFEDKELKAPLYIEPGRPPIGERLSRVPRQLAAAYRTARKSRHSDFFRFVEYASGHNVGAAMRLRRKRAAGHEALRQVRARTEVPDSPYLFFGFHMQPESSIDVWAPFYSDQFWVVEQIARAMPPTHSLLVKVHKSDVSRFSSADFQRLTALPGVEMVDPQANARTFIEASDLVVAIQGTIGLEGALLGKPVIMFGDSPVTIFPNAQRVGCIHDLPELIGDMLDSERPDRDLILQAYSQYLAPFQAACHNNWNNVPSDEEIDGFVQLYDRLERYLSSRDGN